MGLCLIGPPRRGRENAAASLGAQATNARDAGHAVLHCLLEGRQSRHGRGGRASSGTIRSRRLAYLRTGYGAGFIGSFETSTNDVEPCSTTGPAGKPAGEGRHVRGGNGRARGILWGSAWGQARRLGGPCSLRWP